MPSCSDFAECFELYSDGGLIGVALLLVWAAIKFLSQPVFAAFRRFFERPENLMPAAGILIVAVLFYLRREWVPLAAGWGSIAAILCTRWVLGGRSIWPAEPHLSRLRWAVPPMVVAIYIGSIFFEDYYYTLVDSSTDVAFVVHVPRAQSGEGATPIGTLDRIIFNAVRNGMLVAAGPAGGVSVLPTESLDAESHEQTHARVLAPDGMTTLAQQSAWRGAPIDIVVVSRHSVAETCGSKHVMLTVTPYVRKEGDTIRWEGGLGRWLEGWTEFRQHTLEEEVELVALNAAFNLLRHLRNSTVIEIEEQELARMFEALAFQFEAKRDGYREPLTESLSTRLRTAASGSSSADELEAILSELVAHYENSAAGAVDADCEERSRRWIDTVSKLHG